MADPAQHDDGLASRTAHLFDGLKEAFSGRKGDGSGLVGMLREVSAGAVAASLTVPLCVGAGVLATTPLGPGWAARGALSGLVCAIAGGIVSALFRRSSFVVSFPTTPIAVIQASVLTTVVAALPGDPSRALGALSLCVVCVGLWQLLFALTGLSRVIRFVPHPVMAGFVSGVAVLIAWHQVPALLGVAHLDGAFDLSPLPHPAVTLFGAAVLAGILLLGHYAPRLPNFLLGLVGGTVLFHLLGAIEPGLHLGATVGSVPATSIAWPVLHWGDVRTVLENGHLTRALFAGSLTLAVVGTLDTFFALRTAQHLASVETDPRRDVFGQGLGNLASALAGGLVVSTSLSVSMANHRAGGRTRVSTIAAGGTLLVAGLLFPSLVGKLPLVVLGAILVATSLRLVDRWSFQVLRLAFRATDRSQRMRAARDGAVIVGVFLATILGRPVVGVAVGFSLSCLLFMLDMSRSAIVRQRDGTLLRSKRIRTHAERLSLAARGRALAVLELRGALFFGNAHSFATDVRALPPPVEVVLLDCRQLHDVDTSGVTALGQAAAHLTGKGRHLLVAGAAAAWFDRTAAVPGRDSIHLFPTLDDALAWAEDRLLAGGTAERAASPGGPVTIASWALGVFDTAHERGFLPLARFSQGELLCRAGEPGDRMWFLRSGSAAVYAKGEDVPLLLARFGPGHPVGEMALLDRSTRAADVVAEEEVEAFLLTAEEFSRILVEDPELGQTILLVVARHLASRLRETNRDFLMAAGGG